MSVIDKIQIIKNVLEIVLKVTNVLVGVVDTVLTKIGELK